MDSRKPLYRVTVNTSGLIFAVVVGLWAAYLVPMWLRRQDELNEARPTERFTTAIRLLSGRAALERRAARETERRRRAAERRTGADPDTDAGEAPAAEPAEVPDLRGYAEPVTDVRRPAPAAEPPQPAVAAAPPAAAATGGRTGGAGGAGGGTGGAGTADGQGAGGTGGAAGAVVAHAGPGAPGVRAKVLARRRRTTMALFLAFALSGMASLTVGRDSFLWVPVVPGLLLSAYIVHLRRQERRRYAITMDRRRAEEAARRLREQRPRPEPAPAAPEPSPAAEGRRALVEQTDHAEWVDQQRHRSAPPEEPDGWEPAPVPLPTYVSAPVAPRHNRAVDLDAPDTWSAARSTSAGTPPKAARPQRTPLFDQYAEEDRRPRAAGE